MLYKLPDLNQNNYEVHIESVDSVQAAAAFRCPQGDPERAVGGGGGELRSCVTEPRASHLESCQTSCCQLATVVEFHM